jgi:hypothetical protein
MRGHRQARGPACHDAGVPVLDTRGRPLDSLRLSVTDRCNLWCHYCMPEDEYTWLPREDLLTLTCRQAGSTGWPAPTTGRASCRFDLW